MNFGFAPITRMKAPSMGKVFQQAMKSREELVKMKERMDENEFLRYRERTMENAKMREFESKNAQKMYELEEKKFVEEARKKVSEIFRSELSPVMAGLLSREIIAKIGHEAVREMNAEQLKQLLVQSPTLKEIIFKLKAGKRTTKREMSAAVEEIKEILEEVQQQ